MSRIIIIILIIVIVIVINNDLIKNSFLMKGLSTTFRQVQFYDQLRSVECWPSRPFCNIVEWINGLLKLINSVLSEI